MIPIFSKQGLLRLAQAVRGGMLCAFDFDGTLAPIVEQPREARIPAALAENLSALARLAPVAVITGRSMKDIRERLPFEPHYVVANHGLEGLPGDASPGMRFEALCRGWIDKLSASFDADPWHDAGIWIEPKGATLSVHYRGARDPEHSARRLAQLLARLVPEARIIGGKDVFNLLPQDAGDKGRALEALMRAGGFGSAIYVGDDLTDESVFSLRRREIVSVRVERDVESFAEFFIERQTDMARLLDELNARLSAWRNTPAVKSETDFPATATGQTPPSRILPLMGEA